MFPYEDSEILSILTSRKEIALACEGTQKIDSLKV